MTGKRAGGTPSGDQYQVADDQRINPLPAGALLLEVEDVVVRHATDFA